MAHKIKYFLRCIFERIKLIITCKLTFENYCPQNVGLALSK